MTKEAILKQYFGYDHFRPLQADVIEAIASGQDCMVLMPTGGGKSICYQVPALLMEGMAIVISPLIALMQDQVQALKANGVAAEYLNSTLPPAQQQCIEQACVSRKVKILYISPEKLFTGNYLTFIKSLKISLFAIDESHCVSFWGHDFRPEYAQLGILKETFPKVPIVALTATADKVTRKDILTQLRIPDARVFISSFNRPNLSLSVKPGRNRIKHIHDFLLRHPQQAGIIYCLSRKAVEGVASQLNNLGFSVGYYHAGLEAEERARIQDAFLRDDVQVLVATIAFGMGIDKSNIRWVLHYNLPKNVESFYQEIGRAGRDGLPSETLLFYSYADVMAQMRFNEELPQERKLLLDAKLERMRQYAESQICRRRILMSYFNESVTEECGNCDVCRNPKTTFDATLLAQKALSAIARTGEKVGMTLLIQVLRGSYRQEVKSRNYHTLKTFGAGKDLKFEEWADYLGQLLNSGLVDIAYDEGHVYKLNQASWQVLRENRQVALSRFVPFEERQDARETPAESKSSPKKEGTPDTLFEHLRKVRKKLADELNLPAYQVFSDATLTDMADKKPVTKPEMMAVSGVGHEKFNRYGDTFINAILDYLSRRQETPDTDKLDAPKVDTQTQSCQLYEQGLNLDEIAQRRGMVSGTIFTHLEKAFRQGKPVDWSRFLEAQEQEAILRAIKVLGIKKGDPIKPLYEHLGQQYDYQKLRIAMLLSETS
jgi:ATP-dependent DNA helicase RecQ